MSDIRRTLMKNSLPPMGPPGVPGLNRGGRGRGGMMGGRRDYTPTSWKKYWDSSEDVTLEGDIFRVYKRGTAGPLLLLLHGGGYSALTWSLFAEVYGRQQPPCVLIGHSMGGAIAVHTAYHGYVVGLAGLVVIDVVEGTAMDALSSMQSFLRGRPQNFNSLQNAIEWSVRSGQTRNVEAARVSMPGQVKNTETGCCGTCDVESSMDYSNQNQETGGTVRADVILEEGSDSDTAQANQPTPAPTIPNENKLPVKKYTWRINLGETEKFWSGWFHGLSSKFLASPPSKMLLLAGIDRLDTDLTVGQMQGKFQMQVLPQCGHAVQEDTPDRVAEVLATYLLRHRLTTPKADFHR
ncbi:phosphatase methylesterase 1-like [Homarus americanus]|uniref:Protein phosphatase methylesterase 1 n=1 Tax=Homarus americanus TaxID=6706 RepID=A0A8J5KJJ1_HOMAM|nr:phosphatase methylesterase 1-like [Homarus americanus]